jgi:acylphosphatase
MICKHIYYSGNVQGVGFRYNTFKIAANYSVTGYVRNTPDGRVEVLAEGSPKEVDGFLADLAERMSGYIRNTQEQSEPPTGQFSRFDIRF